MACAQGVTFDPRTKIHVENVDVNHSFLITPLPSTIHYYYTEHTCAGKCTSDQCLALGSLAINHKLMHEFVKQAVCRNRSLDGEEVS